MTVWTGSGQRFGFLLRRDRVRIPIWLIALSFFAIVMVPLYASIFDTPQGVQAMAEVMKSPAMVAVLGPLYTLDGTYTTGGLFGNSMLLFTAIAVAVMNILFITRHTRQDEELGRWELLRSLPVGRLSGLTGALLASVFFNLVLALVVGLGMIPLAQTGMTANGCLLFGAALGAIGIVFAGLTAAICQLTANNRTAVGLSFMALLVFYMMRATGDISNETLSLLSPLGLVLRVQSFVANEWWPIGVLALEALALFGLAMRLNSVRDLGGGLLPDRAGRAKATPFLAGVNGLAGRLTHTSAVVWVISLFVLAAMYGSVFGDLDSFFEGNELLRQMMSSGGGGSPTEQFVSLIIVVMSMIATIPVIGVVRRVWSEEKRGASEVVLAQSVSRPAYFRAYAIRALVYSVLFQAAIGLGFWVAGSAVTTELPSLSEFLIASFAYLPAIWLIAAVTVLLIGVLPRAGGLVWLWLAFSFFAIYFGQILNLDDWVKRLTPFGYVARLPMEPLEPFPLIAMAAMALALAVLGFSFYRARDLKTD